MSGHSKWSQIKRQKGAADIKRGAAFSKLTNAIIIAAKSGKDSETNFALKMAIERARTANMPKDTIERAIKRGTGELGGAEIIDVLYEAIGPERVSILIEAATDNKNRANAAVKNILSSYGGKLASAGAVSYQFKRLGRLLIDTDSQNQEELELKVIDAGAIDFELAGNLLIVYTNPKELELVKKALESLKAIVKEASLVWKPSNLIKIDDKNQAQKVIKLLEDLEGNDDVTAVYSNIDQDFKNY